MSKVTTLPFLLLGLLIVAFLARAAARPEPSDHLKRTTGEVQPKGVTEEQEDCGDECMMRRSTLEAHLDYIYTQEKKN